MTNHFGSAWDLPVGATISGDDERATKTHNNHNAFPWTDGNGLERDNDWAHRQIAEGAEVRLPEEAT